MKSLLDLPYDLNSRLRYVAGLSEFAQIDDIRTWLRAGVPCRGLGPVRRRELAVRLGMDPASIPIPRRNKGTK